MMGMTAAVLLTVCLNLASMLLARGRARRKEFAVRLAIGGGRARIVRQLLVEGLLLSIAGGAFGIALGLYAVDALVASLSGDPADHDRARRRQLARDRRAAPSAFCVLATVGSSRSGPRSSTRAPTSFPISRCSPATTRRRAAGVWCRATHWSRRRWRCRWPADCGGAASSAWRSAPPARTWGFDADETVLAEVDGQLGGLDEPQSPRHLRAASRSGSSALPGVHSASIGALVPLGMVNMSKDVQRAGVAAGPGRQAGDPRGGPGV